MNKMAKNSESLGFLNQIKHLGEVGAVDRTMAVDLWKSVGREGLPGG